MIVSTVILAAGQGTRMLSSLPKVLHPLAGKPFIEYSLLAAESLGGETPVVVVGHGADAVRSYVGDRARFTVQVRQRGTAHALLTAEPILAGQSDLVVVISADMPLLIPSTLRRMVEIQTANPGPITMLTVRSQDSHGFGHVVRTEDGSVKAIVEEAVATPEELAIDELNAGVYCFSAEWLWPALHRIKVSPKGEYYLTDTVGLAAKKGLRVEALTLSEPQEAIGINTRQHQAEAEAILRRRINTAWMLEGITIIDPDTTYIGPDVRIGKDTIIYPGTHLAGTCEIGHECCLGPNAMLTNTRVGSLCQIGASVLEGAIVEDRVKIGPFCHLLPGAYLAAGVVLGNYVEVSNSYLAPGVQIPHFSFIGETTVGENVTIEAGAVVCNCESQFNQPTEIGSESVIGAGTMIVSPVKIGDGIYTPAGSVVESDVPSNGPPNAKHTQPELEQEESE